MRVCSSPACEVGVVRARWIPPVASAACCRNVLAEARVRTSMGIPRRCAAKMAFMVGMYWALLSGLALRIRIREVREPGTAAPPERDSEVPLLGSE
jgi:hypothetical protein